MNELWFLCVMDVRWDVKKNDGKTVHDKDEDDRVGASSRPMVQQQKQDCHRQHKRQEKHNRGHQNIGVQSSQCVLNDRVQDVDLERVFVFWFLDFQREFIDNVCDDFVDPHRFVYCSVFVCVCVW